MALICDKAFKIRSAEKNEDGFLVVTGVAAKTGKLEYPEDDKTDYVTEDALTGKSLETMRGATLVAEHPPSSKVSPDNYKYESVGIVREADFIDGKQVVEVEIRDKDAIEAVESGEKTGLSPGYEPKRVEADEDDDFDRKQVGRRNNHLALTDSPRGEDETRLLVDSVIQEDKKMEDEDKEQDEEMSMDALAAKVDSLADSVGSLVDMMGEEESEEDAEEEPEPTNDSFKREFAVRRKAMDAADKVGVEYTDEDDTIKIMSGVVKEHTGSAIETDSKGAIEGAFHVAASQIDQADEKSSDAERFEDDYFENMENDSEDDLFEDVGMFS